MNILLYPCGEKIFARKGQSEVDISHKHKGKTNEFKEISETCHNFPFARESTYSLPSSCPLHKQIATENTSLDEPYRWKNKSRYSSMTKIRLTLLHKLQRVLTTVLPARNTCHQIIQMPNDIKCSQLIYIYLQNLAKSSKILLCNKPPLT